MTQTQGIILAAGYSSRAKTNKLLLPLGSKTVIECCIASMIDFCSQIFVVGGYRIDELKPVLSKYKRLQLVANVNYADGMFRSVKEGLKYITSDQFLLTPGDYPLIQKATIAHILDRSEQVLVPNENGEKGYPVLIPTYHGEKGHPVLIQSYLIPEILQGGFGNLREFVDLQKPQLLEVDDIGVITDIDTMQDYERILTMLA